MKAPCVQLMNALPRFIKPPCVLDISMWVPLTMPQPTNRLIRYMCERYGYEKELPTKHSKCKYVAEMAE